MLMRAKVDFFEVAADQRVMDQRLENWAQWCNGTGGSGVSPMFRLYRAPRCRDPYADTSRPVDSMDAQAVAKGVAALPELHRAAISWCYVIRSGPKKACTQLGVSHEGLALLVRDGRRMLINRSV